MGDQPMNGLTIMASAATFDVQHQYQQQQQQLMIGRSEGMWFWCKMCRRNFPRMDVLIAHKRFMHPQLFDQPKPKPFFEHTAPKQIQKEEEEEDPEDLHLVQKNNHNPNHIELIQLSSSSSGSSSSSSESSSEDEEEIGFSNDKMLVKGSSKSEANDQNVGHKEDEENKVEEEDEDSEPYYVLPELRPRRKVLRYHQDHTRWTKPRQPPLVIPRLQISPTSPPPSPSVEGEMNVEDEHYGDLEEIRKVEEILSKYVVAQVFEGQKIYLCRLCLKPFSNFSSASNHVRTHSRNFKAAASPISPVTTSPPAATPATKNPISMKSSSTVDTSRGNSKHFVQNLSSKSSHGVTNSMYSNFQKNSLKNSNPRKNLNSTKKLNKSTSKATNGHSKTLSVSITSMTVHNHHIGAPMRVQNGRQNEEPMPEPEIELFRADEEEEESNNNFVQWYLVPKDDDDEVIVKEKTKPIKTDHPKKIVPPPSLRPPLPPSKNNRKHTPASKLPQGLKTRAEFHYFTRKRGHQLKYVCKYCQKEFQSSCRVSWHVPTHTGERNFKCRKPNCDRAFANIGNQLQHEKLCKGGGDVSSSGGAKNKKNLTQKMKRDVGPLVTMETKNKVEHAGKNMVMAAMIKKSKKKNRFPVLHRRKRPRPISSSGHSNELNSSKKSHWPIISEREANRIVDKCLATSPADFYGDDVFEESEPEMPPQNPPSATARARHNKGAPGGGDLYFNFQKNGGQVKEEPSGEDVDFEDNKNSSGGPRRYCLCRQFSYGKMVACANRKCPWEWFHFPCVGLNKKPRGSWRCEHCADGL